MYISKEVPASLFFFLNETSLKRNQWCPSSTGPMCVTPHHARLPRRCTPSAPPSPTPPRHLSSFAPPRWSSHLPHSVNCLQCLLSRPTRTWRRAETAPTISGTFAVKGRRRTCKSWNRSLTCARLRVASAAALPVCRRSDDSRTGASDFIGYRGNCLLWMFRPCTLAVFPGTIITCHISLTTFLVRSCTGRDLCLFVVVWFVFW